MQRVKKDCDCSAERSTEQKQPIWLAKHGMSEAPFYNWKAKYGGMDASEARRLKAPEDKHAT
jgi:hypothetical protein